MMVISDGHVLVDGGGDDDDDDGEDVNAFIGWLK